MEKPLIKNSEISFKISVCPLDKPNEETVVNKSSGDTSYLSDNISEDSPMRVKNKELLDSKYSVFEFSAMYTDEQTVKIIKIQTRIWSFLAR